MCIFTCLRVVCVSCNGHLKEAAPGSLTEVSRDTDLSSTGCLVNFKSPQNASRRTHSRRISPALSLITKQNAKHSKQLREQLVDIGVETRETGLARANATSRVRRSPLKYRRSCSRLVLRNYRQTRPFSLMPISYNRKL